MDSSKIEKEGPLYFSANVHMFELPPRRTQQIGLLLLALFFMAAGISHFLNSDVYVAIMPPYLPAHLELVYFSGLLEILGGIGVALSPTRQWAGYGLIILLMAVFPANLYMAMNPDKFVDILPAWSLYARLPIQFLLIGWTWWATRPVQMSV